MPKAWFAELLHTFYAKLVVDLTPGDGKFAWEALSRRIGYLGIAFTDEHATELINKLRQLTLEAMKDPSSMLYTPAFAKAVGDDLPPAVPAVKAKAKAKTKAKAKAKAAAEPVNGEEADPWADPAEGDPDGEPALDGETLWDPDA